MILFTGTQITKRMMTVIQLCLLFGLFNQYNVMMVHGFAYAPNFITKIISQTTGQEPVGLMEVTSNENEKSNPKSTATATAFVEEVNDADADDTSIVDLGRPITTRFPPEPNGYLHLGHAKAVSFNFAVGRMFQDGRCHMRLDDTNPSKEDQEYVDSILEDVQWIQSGTQPFGSDDDTTTTPQDDGPWYGSVRKTSDYFETIYDCAVSLIKSGDAYVDSLTAEEMREYRGSLTTPGKDSPFKNRSVEENLELFEQMRAGKMKDGECVLRAKIDMTSPNINMRDPALYRIKHESHPATGDEWCIYPMYDFSHPIADSLEGITHSLCTLEFEDHRPFYDWTVEKLMGTGLLEYRPRQIEFSRLNLKYTVLSKRKLIQLVEGNHVNGWDDPRMPTLAGVRRRGVPPEALRMLCERVGISKVDSVIDASELENCIREVMDESSKRAFAILEPLKVTISNWQGSKLEDFEVPSHPKHEEMGDRTVPFGKHLYIERSDFFDLEGKEGEANGGRAPKGFKRLLPGGMVRLRYAYVIECDEVIRDEESGEPVELKCTLYPETRAGVTPEGMPRVKGIIQWVEASTGIKCKINQYDRLFKAEEPGKNTDNFLDDINPDSLKVLDNAIVEPSVGMDTIGLLAQMRAQESEGSNKKILHSDLAYQFERSGYFALDKAATTGKLIFNRVVTLRDTWAVSKNAKKKGNNDANQRNRGGNKAQGKGGNNGAVVEDARRVELRVGTILEVDSHPDADTLIVCKVDCGDEDGATRTVVAGLGGKIPFEQLTGRKIAFVTNLKPSKIRGVESTAMILAASDGVEGPEEKVELLDIPESVANGELLSFEGKEASEPDAMMKSKGAIKAFERFKGGLKVNESGEATYLNEDKEFRMMTSEGPVQVASLKDVTIQ